jgi:3-phosphoshikimate 1-carboxyvinyltransferase
MRLLAGLLAAAPFGSVLFGDESLSSRPMERVAEPLREMGARIATTNGYPPIRIDGGPLHGIRYVSPVPSAQLKSAVLLAGTAAAGETTVEERVSTRDHTERALRALGARVEVRGTAITLSAFQHEGFAGTVPGDPSSAAFLVGAAALTGSEITIADVGLNPTRLRFLDVLERMGLGTERRPLRDEMDEPIGDLWVAPATGLTATEVTAEELPLVIDEVPVLAVVAAHAEGETRFTGAGELRVKETDRLGAIAEGIRELGGIAGVEGDDLVVSGLGLRGGETDGRGDHRIAMALTVGALAADAPCRIGTMEAAEVSFPGFVETLHMLGAGIEVAG